MTTDERERLAKRFEDQGLYLNGEARDGNPSALVNLVRAEVYFDAARIVREQPAEVPTSGHRELIVRWIIDNVDSTVVPGDEGNGDALRYNLVGLARHGRDYRRYTYQPDQDREIAGWLASGPPEERP